MATAFVTCPAGVYTQIGNGGSNVSFRVKTGVKTTQIRLANASSAPATSTTNYVNVSDRKWKSFSGVLNNLYVMPIGSGAILEVIDNT